MMLCQRCTDAIKAHTKEAQWMIEWTPLEWQLLRSGVTEDECEFPVHALLNKLLPSIGWDHLTHDQKEFLLTWCPGLKGFLLEANLIKAGEISP